MKNGIEKYLSEIENGRSQPVYLLHGDENLLIEQSTNLLLNSLSGENSSDFGVDRFSAPETSPAEIVGSLSQLDVFGGSRIILVRHIEEVKADWLAGLLKIISEPLPETCLILTSNKKIAKNTKFYKAVAGSGAALEFSSLNDREITSWLDAKAREAGKKIEPKAKMRLIARAGIGLAELSMEFEKLLLFIGSKKTITEDDVASAGASIKGYDVFDLGEAVAEKNAMRALTILHHLSQTEGVSAGPAWVGLLAHKVRTLWRTRSLMENNFQGNWAKELKVAPFFVNDYKTPAQGFTSEKLGKAVVRLHKTDIGLKTGSPIVESLEALILWLCR